MTVTCSLREKKTTEVVTSQKERDRGARNMHLAIPFEGFGRGTEANTKGWERVG